MLCKARVWFKKKRQNLVVELHVVKVKAHNEKITKTQFDLGMH